VLALGAPLSARAQAAARRVFLLTGTPAFKDAFVAGLHEHGWNEGRKFELEWIGDYTQETAPKEIERALDRDPEVLVLAGPLAIAAASKLTKRNPIVGIDLESDPVAAGFVRSLARPGGNVTGVWLDLPGLAGKQVQFLREIAPGIAAAGVLWDDRVGAPQFEALKAAARAANLTIYAAAIRVEADADAAVERVARDGAKAVIALTAPIIFRSRARIAELGLKHRLPVFSVFTAFPDAGAFLAYGPNLAGMFRQAAGHVHRILRGAKPAEIPVERPTKFELVVNAKTAQALGIRIPVSLLARADRVIE